MIEAASITDIELYEALKPKIGEKEARSLIAFVEFKSEKKFEEKKETLATKEDVRRIEGICSGLEVKIESVRSSLEVKIESVRSGLEVKMESVQTDITDIKGDVRRLGGICSGLEVRIESVRSDILRWMFLFWMGQFAALIAVLQIFFKR